MSLWGFFVYEGGFFGCFWGGRKGWGAGCVGMSLVDESEGRGLWFLGLRRGARGEGLVEGDRLEGTLWWWC